jgi:hypothetical protein
VASMVCVSVLGTAKRSADNVAITRFSDRGEHRS